MINEFETDFRVSQSTNPYFNLALEEWLLRNASSDFIVFVYRNRPSIILGRNQNPWLECNLTYAKANGCLIARRISGGGTVYHDLGNTNFTFIMPREKYDPKVYLRLAVEALARQKIKVKLTSRHNLFIDSAKVSGTAFMLTGKRALQHGTLLINANLDTLKMALTPGKMRVETNAVASVADKVVNLSGYSPDISHDVFTESLTDVLAGQTMAVRKSSITEEEFHGNQTFQTYLDKQKDWEWIFGRTPAFVLNNADNKSATEPANIRVTIRKGRISKVEMPSACSHLPLPSFVLEKHLGKRFSRNLLFDLQAAFKKEPLHNNG